MHENNKLQEFKETVNSLENKKTIMEQKRARLNDNYRMFEREIKEI